MGLREQLLMLRASQGPFTPMTHTPWAALLPSAQGRAVIGTCSLPPSYPNTAQAQPTPRNCPSHRDRTPRSLKKLPSVPARIGLGTATMTMSTLLQGRSLWPGWVAYPLGTRRAVSSGDDLEDGEPWLPRAKIPGLSHLLFQGEEESRILPSSWAAEAPRLLYGLLLSHAQPALPTEPCTSTALVICAQKSASPPLPLWLFPPPLSLHFSSQPPPPSPSSPAPPTHQATTTSKEAERVYHQTRLYPQGKRFPFLTLRRR